MPSKYENMTMEELKEMCRKNNISGYSTLNKADLIKLYKKNSKGKKVNQNKTKLMEDNGALEELYNQFSEHKNKKSLYKKKIMKGGIKLNDETIQIAVDLWCTDKNRVENIFGHISDWDVSNVTDMSNLFDNKENFNDDISKWDVSNVVNMAHMFDNAISFNQPIGTWDVSSVTNMEGMFYDAKVFNQPINTFEQMNIDGTIRMCWDVSNVTIMANMFYNAVKFNQPIGNWNVSSVTDMSGMFFNARKFNQDINNWNVNSVIGMHDIFEFTIMTRLPLWYIDNNLNNFIPNYNIVKSITIKKNILNNKNNTCNTKLYDFILKLDIDNSRRIQFRFEGQVGIDAGGLSRTVFDLFYKTYINNFFTIEETDENIINISSYNNEKNTILENATNKLIILAKNAKVKIYMHINDVLLNLLMGPNPIEEINLNNKDTYNKKDALNNAKRNNLFGNNSTISQVIVLNNNNNNKKWKKKLSNIINNSEKKEVYLRRYLKQIGFESFKQFVIMHDWIRNYWITNPDLFTNKLSFSKEDFMKRIKLKKGADTNEYNLTNTILNNNSNNSFIKKYPNLKVLLDYIKMDDDMYRQKFCAWATGSIFSNAIIIITLFDFESLNNNPFIVHTCSNQIDVYQTNPNPMFDIEQLKAQISSNAISFNIA